MNREHTDKRHSTPDSPLLAAGLRQPLTTHAPVLALTLLREGEEGPEVLCVVRRPETNATHPDVLSVPTMRVPVALAREWPAATLDGHTVTGLPYAVECLLTRKLGLGDALESGWPRYDLGRFGAWQGGSYIGVEDGCDVIEDLTMYNVEVRFRHTYNEVPSRTASYAPILWTPVPRFLEVVATRDVGRLRADLDEILVCVRGLCVETTLRLLER